MYNTKEAVKAALGQSVVRMRLLSESVPYSRIDGEQLDRLSYSAGCCDGDIGIGSVSAASLSGSIHGVINLLGVTFTAQVGVDVEGVTQWLNLGTFSVTECSRTDDATTFTAYDAAYTDLGAVYTPTVQSGATVYAVLEDIADQCGLDVEQTTLNYGLQIPVAGTLTGHTCREMVGYLAALCGKNAVITRDGFLRFVFVTQTEQTVTADDYYAGAMSNGGISKLWGLSCTVPGQEEEQILTVGDAEKAVTVSCPYMTQAQLERVWYDIGGYEYPVCNVSFYRGLLTEPGDVVSLTNLAGVTISFPAMHVSLEIDGGCRCTISSFGKSEAVRISGTAGPTEKRLQSVQKTASRAMTSANGKNKVFHQSSAPATSEGLTVGDLWFNTALGNQIATWDGNQWSAFRLQDAAVSNLDAGSITTGTLNAARIGANSIGAGKLSVNALSAITANAGTLTAGVLQSSNYSAGAAGTKLDLTNGTADITGTIRAQAGNIGDFNISSGGFTFYTDEVGGTEVALIPSEAYSPDYVFFVGKRISATSSEIKIALGRNGDINAGGNISCIGSATINRGLSVLEGATVYRGLEVATGDLDVAGSIKHYGNPYLKSASRGISYSCAAGASYGDTLTFGVSISGEPGYTPIGIIGWTTGSNNVVLPRLYLGNNYTQLNFTVRNVGSSTVSGTLNVVFLFQAD